MNEIKKQKKKRKGELYTDLEEKDVLPLQSKKMYIKNREEKCERNLCIDLDRNYRFTVIGDEKSLKESLHWIKNKRPAS